MDFIDFPFILTAVPRIAKMIPVTLFILLVALIFGIALGFAGALCRVYRVKGFSGFFRGYVSFIRGTPFLIQLFLVYYVIPSVMNGFGVDLSGLSRTVFVIITFSINSGAYISEILRAAIESVGGSQREAAISVGMSGRQAFQFIILPQSLRLAVPNFGNTFLTLLKETSLAFNIGVIDIMGQARVIGGYSYHFFEVYTAAAIVYWGLSIVFEALFHVLAWLADRERRLAHG